MLETPAAQLQREREEARALLTEGYAQDWIDQSELDRRLEAAEHAVSVAELRALTDELRPVETTALVPVSQAPARERIPAVLATVERHGAWAVAPHTRVRAVLGGVVLDLRQAVLPPGPIEIEATVILGSLDILVPPGWRVDSRCGAVLATVEQDHTARAPAAGARVLKISGRVVLGSLSVRERLPGESAGAARRRRKREMKALAQGDGQS